MRRTEGNRPRSFVEELLSHLRTERERLEANERASVLARLRVDRRDHFAHTAERSLHRPDLAAHIEAIAKAFGMPAEHVRAAVALEVGRNRARQLGARDAVIRHLEQRT